MCTLKQDYDFKKTELIKTLHFELYRYIASIQYVCIGYPTTT